MLPICNQLPNLFPKLSSKPRLDHKPILNSPVLLLLWTPMLMLDHNKFTYQLMRRETLHSRFHQPINSILLTVLLLSLSERLLVTILSNPSERRTDQRAKTSQTTTTSPSQWWSKESQLKLLPPQPRTHITQMEILPLPQASIRASHMMIEQHNEVLISKKAHSQRINWKE